MNEFIVIAKERLMAADTLACMLESAIRQGVFHEDSIYAHQLRIYQAFVDGAPIAMVPHDAIGFALPSLTLDKKLTHVLFPRALLLAVRGGEEPAEAQS